MYHIAMSNILRRRKLISTILLEISAYLNSKHDSQILGLRLRERSLQTIETKTTVHLKRSADFSKYYT
jgi:hypothetical protein